MSKNVSFEKGLESNCWQFMFFPDSLCINKHELKNINKFLSN